jgi:hypothetical protein
MTLVIGLTAAGEAHAHYGFARGYGWGGWGGASTPGGCAARGMGMLGMGAGMFNLDTAQARSINTNTMMRFDQGMFNGSRVGARMYAAREKSLKEQNEKSYSEVQDRMTLDGQWPEAVLGDEFKPEREGVRKAIKAALEEDKQGEVDPDSVQAVQAAINQLRAKFEQIVPQTRPDYASAHWALKAMDGITKMLYSPTMDKVLAELEDYQGTKLGDLLGFMQAFNLRFGPAKSYRQRLIYR